MTTLQESFIKHAREKCLPYLLALDQFKPYEKDLCVLLVGSVATGLCNKNSDIDVAIIADEKLYKRISEDTSWRSGRPTEAVIDGVQLHYYGRSIKKIRAELHDLDDIALYLYSHVRLLHDPRNIYESKMSSLLSSNSIVRRARIEGKLDMLLRRSRVLEQCLSDSLDVHLILKIWLEILTLTLKVIALLDDVPFDPRKRLFATALSSAFGSDCRHLILAYIHDLPSGLELDGINAENAKSLLGPHQEIIAMLSNRARKLGFRVGLGKPDRRHLEQ